MSRPNAKPCHFFNTSQGCRRGAGCTFSHVAASAPKEILDEKDLPKGVCRIYWKHGHCKYGSACTYKHSMVDPAATPRSPEAQSIDDERSGAARAKHPVSSSPPPYGVCRKWWMTGSCQFEFKCRYKHSAIDPARRQQIQAQSTEDTTVDDVLAQRPSSPGQSIGAIGRPFSIPIAKSDRQLSPTEAQTQVRRFLHDNFRFIAPHEVYGFLKVVNAASRPNSSWSPVDYQLFFEALSTGNGLLRVVDILTWPDISATPSFTNRDILSFQRGLIPILQFMASDTVVKSTLREQSSVLWNTLLENFNHFSSVVKTCMTDIMQRMSFFESRSKSNDDVGIQFFVAMSTILYEILVRFKNIAVSKPLLADLINSVQEWFITWKDGVTASSPSFDDPFADKDANFRSLLLTSIDEKFARIRKITDRDQGREKKAINLPVGMPLARFQEGLIAALETTFEGPGVLREAGPRHDNDHVDIYDIRIAPTHEELMCRVPPFLPANLYGAPHPAPPETPARLLDIQYRLLREELTAPLRQAIQNVVDDLNSPKRTTLSELLKKGGGKYKGHSDGRDSVLFNVYSDVQFKGFVPERRGIETTLVFKAPPGRARSAGASARAAFWEGMSGKRLTQGGLVALVWKSGVSGLGVHLGIVASSARDIAEHVRKNAETVGVRVVFFDAAIELRILQDLQNKFVYHGDTKMLVESPVLFEAIRPFLQSLKMEPEVLPFADYLVHHSPDFFRRFSVQPPKYTRDPGAPALDLKCLLTPEAEEDGLTLITTNRESVRHARDVLRQSSCLDPSQADSVVDALTREVSLIQGPPGTGKSYTGLQLLKVLLANNIRPILLIAFTNHALDHMLASVLDAGITRSIVRLGSRSADERIADFSIETLEKVAGRTRLSDSFHQRYKDLRASEEELKKLLDPMVKGQFPSESNEIVKYMDLCFPEHYEEYRSPPEWTRSVLSAHKKEEEGWMRQGTDNRGHAEDISDYALWRSAIDIDFLDRMDQQKPEDVLPEQLTGRDSTPAPTSRNHNTFGSLPVDDSNNSSDSDESDADDELPPAVESRWLFDLLVQDDRDADEKESFDAAPQSDFTLTMRDSSSVPLTQFGDPLGLNLNSEPVDRQPPRNHAKHDFFAEFGYSSPPITPTSRRPLQYLLDDGNIWNMSRGERATLHGHWHKQARATLYETRLGEFERLRERHEERLHLNNEGKEETKRQLMRSAQIIGCTTTGAAKLTSLLKGLEPRILLVEEAGQVLEAHVLGSLVPSIEHVILIGDPLQLRPTLNNFSLSMDNREGRELYKFDMSLMERLSSSGFPMSQINVQRRMRPIISSLIRNTLYPQLQDHEVVRSYPHVKGIAQDLFFFTHENAEGGGTDEGASKYNVFEVDMIKDLVLYLLRQGCYSNDGDIVVLCAYLGQLARLRDTLADEVAVIIDERDQVALADQEDGNVDVDSDDTGGGQVERVNVTKRVRLRTVDNYQGEEANVVILSLVRNSGALDEEMEALGITASKRTNIGFLKSENRTNVALSRARHGLFIFGNATNLASRSKMWRSVIEELEAAGRVGTALPIRCERHPERIEEVSTPGRLPKIAPDGGCMLPCSFRLECGHMCSYKCHGDDPKHVSVVCLEKCRKLCARGHPCSKDCAEPCGNCLFPMPDVTLPCGHTKDRVSCYQMDDLDSVRCIEEVVKKLPNCEHEVTTLCCADPASLRCQARCDRIMTCCGQTCPRQCGECQLLNMPDTASDESRPVTRVNHVKHACQKRLYCEHRCSEPCSEDHTHSTTCSERCRQVCKHARCALPCSVPCAPCQAPCTWSCPHFKCPVPCGSVCVRLPCDKRCETELRCGHRCPSVCGEDCAIQICPECATEDQKRSVVDMILQLTLEDVTPDDETLESLLITLPSCKHVFTVETLDGICSLSEYYKQSEEGKWMGLDNPPHGIKQPPTCPTCRLEITSPRYGRVYKRARLDISERNVASKMSKDLEAAQTLLSKFSIEDAETSLKASAGKLYDTSTSKTEFSAGKVHKAHGKVLRVAPEQAISERDLNVGNKIHRIDEPTQDAWRKATQRLFAAYRDVARITETRSAHLRAYEAAFSTLYEQEMDTFRVQQRAPAQPEQNAMRVAWMTVGQPRPLADKRFMVEALWMTVDIRLRLARLGLLWLDAVVGKAWSQKDVYSPAHQAAWGTYLAFIFATALRDANLALTIARASHSRRQVSSSALLILRLDLERFSFNLTMLKRTNFAQATREELAGEVEARIVQMQCDVTEALEKHVEGVDADLADGEQAWLQANFLDNTALIIEEWQKILTSLQMDTFYQPVSLEEKMQIVKALMPGFGHAGHFYNCPNGHMYTITECGGAMERARCPECGLGIGGQNHRLDQTNTRATEFEALAQEAGTGPSAWANPH